MNNPSDFLKYAQDLIKYNYTLQSPKGLFYATQPGIKKSQVLFDL
jgi:hypothetical protein